MELLRVNDLTLWFGVVPQLSPQIQAVSQHKYEWISEKLASNHTIDASKIVPSCRRNVVSRHYIKPISVISQTVFHFQVNRLGFPGLQYIV